MLLLSELLSCIEIKAESELLPSVTSQSCTYGKYATFSAPRCFYQVHTLAALLFPFLPWWEKKCPCVTFTQNQPLTQKDGQFQLSLTCFKWLISFSVKTNVVTLSFPWKALTINNIYYFNAIYLKLKGVYLKLWIK